MQILCFKEEIIKAVSQSLIGQTLLLNLTGDELGHGGRDQQDSGSQGSQKMSGSATKKIRQTIFIFNLVFNLRYKRFTSTSRIYLDISEIGVKLLWHVCAQAGSWSLLLFVTDDLVPANVRLSSTKLLLRRQKKT